MAAASAAASPGGTTAPEPVLAHERREDVAVGADDRQAGPDVVEHPRAEREVRLEVLAMRADAEVGLGAGSARARRTAPSR